MFYNKTMQVNALNKEELRLEARAKIKNLLKDREDFYNRQSQLIEKIELSPFFKKANTVLAYFPLDDEFDLCSMIISNPNKRWVLPRPIGKGIMLLFEVTELYDLKEVKYGVKAPPATNTFVKAGELDLVIIPGLGFDQDGYRLGRGGGYYDRLLEKLSIKCKSIGVIPEELMVAKLPRASHDRAVNKVLTV